MAPQADRSEMLSIVGSGRSVPASLPGRIEAQCDSAGEAVRMWGKLGYPGRALRLHACAGAVVESHGGELPATLEALLALPGVGEYTARARLAFAFVACI